MAFQTHVFHLYLLTYLIFLYTYSCLPTVTHFFSDINMHALFAGSYNTSNFKYISLIYRDQKVFVFNLQGIKFVIIEVKSTDLFRHGSGAVLLYHVHIALAILQLHSAAHRRFFGASFLAPFVYRHLRSATKTFFI